MHDLKLIDDTPVLRTAQPPSYYDYHAARTLPGDKKWKEYRAALGRTYLAAQLEYQLRQRVQQQRDEFIDSTEVQL